MVSLAGFIAFLRGSAQIPVAAIADDDQHICWAYDLAIETVLLQLKIYGGKTIYMMAVYNLGTDRLINLAPDAKGQTYFMKLREDLGINSFTAGVVTATSDETTSTTLTTPDAFKNLTIGDLQNLKTPWGRDYLATAQKFGTLWGIS
jgi:hypothetical protein